MRNIEATTSRELFVPEKNVTEATCMAFAPDGKSLAIGHRDGGITIWDVATKRRVRARTVHARFIKALAFSPDGRTLASSGDDRAIEFWDMPSNECHELPRKDRSTVSILEYSPIDDVLAAADFESPFIRLWDSAGKIERPALEGQTGNLLAMAITHDGCTLAAADFRGRITFWDLRTLRPAAIRLEHPGVRPWPSLPMIAPWLRPGSMA